MKVSAVARDFAPLNDGGKAEKHPHVPVAKHEVEAGSKVEREHTDSKTKARAIAVDHLVEIPDYYKRLSKLESKAKDEGKKRASMEPMKGPTLEDQHAHELATATDEANAGLQKKRVLAEIAAGLAAAPSMLPGVGLFLPNYDETRDAAMDVLHRHAQNEAEALGVLQSRQNATRVLNAVHEQPKTAAGEMLDPLQNMEAQPRGDELHLPIGNNPYAGDQKQTEEYENGFAYAQARGVAQLNQVTAGDVQRWAGNSPAWRAGFSAGARKLGIGRVGDAVDPSKASSLSDPGVPMTKILPCAPELMKTAMGQGLSTLLGAGMGAGLGAVGGHEFGSFAPEMQQHLGLSAEDINSHLPAGFGMHEQHQPVVPHHVSPDAFLPPGSVNLGPVTHFDSQGQPLPTQMHPAEAQRNMSAYDVNSVADATADRINREGHANATATNANRDYHNMLGGSAIGAGLGGMLGAGLGGRKYAAFKLDIDGDLKGSALEVLICQRR